MAHIHITGASGSGVSTLGRALAEHHGFAHLDTDDFYWAKTDPPFTTKVERADRLANLRAAMAMSPSGWVLSGSIGDWGNELIPMFDFVIFMTAPTPVRMARLRAREKEHYGADIEPGGKMHEIHRAFLDWASRYDEPDFDSRSRHKHEAWLARVSCPVLHLDGTRPVTELTEEVYRTTELHQGRLRPPS